MLPKLTKDEQDVFWQKIVRVGEPNECWNLRHPTRMISILGGLYDPYRIAYFLHTGDDPGYTEIEHQCNNWRCCNPYHLRLVFNRTMEERCLAAYDAGERMTLSQIINELQDKVNSKRKVLDAAKKVKQLLELGDQRLLAGDGPCGGQNAAVALTAKESAELYQACRTIVKAPQ